MTILRAVLLVSLSLTACTTVDVSKVSPSDETAGLRYSLPRPLIVVTPKADGTLDVRVEMVPDPEHTYAITAQSYLATHNLVVKTSNGLLTNVEWTADTSAVAAESTKAAGEIAKAFQEAEAAERKADRESAKKDASAAEERVRTLQGKIAEAELEVSIAAAELEATKDTAKKEAAAIKHEAAQAKLQGLRDQLARLRSSGALVAGQVAPGSPAADLPTVRFKDVAGPVMFEVVQELGTETETPTFILREVEKQEHFQVYAAPRKSENSRGGVGGGSVKTEPTNFEISLLPAEQNLTVDKEFETFVGSPPVLAMDEMKQPVADDKAPTAERVNSKSIKLKFPATHPKGKFTLEIALGATDGTTVIGRSSAMYTVK